MCTCPISDEDGTAVTPTPPEPEDSGIRPLTVREAKAIKEAEEMLERSKRLKRYVFGAATLVVTTAIGTVSFLAWGQSKIDAGVERAVEPIERRTTAVEADVKEIKGQMIVLKETSIRQTTMLEMLVRDRGMEPPKPVDGGQ